MVVLRSRNGCGMLGSTHTRLQERADARWPEERESRRQDELEDEAMRAKKKAERRQRYSYGPMFGKAHMAYEREQARMNAALRPPNFAQSIAAPAANSAGVRTGRERLAAIKLALDSFGLERSDMQKQFHNDMLGACARLIFKDDLEANIDDLLIELGISELRPEFMA